MNELGGLVRLLHEHTVLNRYAIIDLLVSKEAVIYRGEVLKGNIMPLENKSYYLLAAGYLLREYKSKGV